MIDTEERRPFSMGTPQPMSDADELYYVDSILSAQGRIRRQTFGIRMIIFGVVQVALEMALFMDLVKGDDSMISWLIVMIMIFIGIVSYLQTIKRFHDLNVSGWHAILVCIPFYNLYLFYRLYFVEGTIGINQYGIDPKPRPATRYK